MDIKKLEKDLKTLCEEANNNNGDYYCDGMIEVHDLERIIQEHFDPDFKWHNPHWGKHPTVDRELTEAEKQRNEMFRQIYEPQILEQLSKESFILKSIEKD